jgi:hypothetical protein
MFQQFVPLLRQRSEETAAKEEPKKESEPARLPGLFDAAADTTLSVASASTAAAPTTPPDKDEDEEADILAEIADSDHHDDTSEKEADGAT